jgi:hypothetical protein
LTTAVKIAFLALTLAASAVLSCTDSHLYGQGIEDTSADRLGITGRVCTDDPMEAGFNIRVVFLVDTAAGPIFSSFDPELLRLKALKETLAIHGGNEMFSFAVVGFGSTARLLAPSEGYFTRNPGELDSAIASLALPQGGVSGIERDYWAGLNLAYSLIEGDLTEMSAGQRSRTQYAVVLMSGGPPAPLSCECDCCELWGQSDCDYSECVESYPCTKDLLRERVAEVRDEVEWAGASSFGLHVLFLAALDDAAEGDPQEVLDETEDILQEMAFAGAGRFERFNTPDAITLDRIGLKKLSSLLEAKSLIVTNVSVLPDQEKDSDGDGMADLHETDLGTSPYSADSDSDGIGDMIEILLFFNPLVPDEKPNTCSELEGPPFVDSDSDRLNDCEEALLGTDASLTDTDGDAVPDWMEVVSGTDYLRVDTLSDSDGDGATNGDEAKTHTDPRSSDASSHLASAYRYEVEDEGFVTEPAVAAPHKILGVTVLSAGSDTTGGLGTLGYSPGSLPTLRWKDPQDGAFGPEVDVSEPGKYQLPSSSVEEAMLERWISVEVDPALLPPSLTEEILLVEISERHCLSFTVRNIKLVETGATEGLGGVNDVFVYFAEAPLDRLTLPGLFRVAHIPVTYHPDTGREPDDLLVEVKDEEFVAVGF